MKFNNPYWTIKTKMELLQRWILVHSFLYYELDESVVSDHMFDLNCMQLKKFIKENKEAYKETRYYYAMKDFDGSSGFGFVQKLDNVHYSLIEGDANGLIKNMSGK